MNDWLPIIEICLNGILIPVIGIWIKKNQATAEAQARQAAEQARLAAERDKLLEEIKKISLQHTETLQHQDSVLREQSEVLEKQNEVLQKQSKILEEQDKILNLHTDQLKAVGDAAKEELGKTLEEMHALFIVQGYVTSQQLKEFEKKYKVYHEGLDGNGVIEKFHDDVISLPIRDDLPAFNLAIEVTKNAINESKNRQKKNFQSNRPNQKKNKNSNSTQSRREINN